MKNTVEIYTLSDPTNSDIRYIGITKRGLNTRLSHHISDKRVNHRTCWIKSLIQKGVEPQIEILDYANSDNWKLFERYWISQFKSWGFNLVNYSDGGDSLSGWKPTPESIEKTRQKLIGQKRDIKSRLKMSESRKKYEAENRDEFLKRYEKMANTMKNKSDEEKRLISVKRSDSIKKANSISLMLLISLTLA